jgi:spore germination protein GerM
MLKEKNKSKIDINKGTKLNTLNKKDGILYVDFSKEFLDSNLNKEKEEFMIHSIVNTLTEIVTVNKVKFLVDGNSNIKLNHISLEKPIERMFRLKKI